MKRRSKSTATIPGNRALFPHGVWVLPHVPKCFGPCNPLADTPEHFFDLVQERMKKEKGLPWSKFPTPRRMTLEAAAWWFAERHADHGEELIREAPFKIGQRVMFQYYFRNCLKDLAREKARTLPAPPVKS